MKRKSILKTCKRNYLNHWTGIVGWVTWVAQILARIHIDVDQALEILTLNKREKHIAVHPNTYLPA